MGTWKGISYPLGNTLAKFVEDKGDYRMLRTSIINILFTRKGEMPMLPEFGSGLQDMLFEPNDTVTEVQIINIVKDDVEEWDPRIEVIGTVIDDSDRDRDMLKMTVRYRMRKTNTEEVDEFSFSVDSSGVVHYS